jgi:hypothetical protein
MTFSSMHDQLNVIFDVIGTPSHEDIMALENDAARKYLLKLPAKPSKYVCACVCVCVFMTFCACGIICMRVWWLCACVDVYVSALVHSCVRVCASMRMCV